MSTNGKVVSLNISTEVGTIKTPVAEATFDARGIVGDAHAGMWHRQVSMLGQETIDEFVAANSRDTKPGEFAENITLSGIDLTKRVRSSDLYSDLPVVVLSTRDRPADRLAGLEAGADAYLTKHGIEPSHLAALIRRVTTDQS